MTPQQAAEERVFLGGNPLALYWDDVSKQAKRHTQRRVSEVVDLISERRPNESDELKLYRAQNERQITRNGVNRFLSKVSRLIRNGLVFDAGGGAELAEYLASDPFVDHGKAYDLEEYIFRCVLPMAFEDPNKVFLAVPYNPNNPDISPNKPVEEGGLSPTEDLGIRLVLERPVYSDEDIVIIHGGYRTIFDDRNRQRTEPYFLCASSDNWWSLEPVFRRVDAARTEIAYEAEIWYRWDLGHSPVNFLPGEIHKSPQGPYKESYLLPYFVFADEVVNAFSDDQAVRTRFGYPHVGIEQTKCKAENCKSGYLNGKKNTPCQVCQGTGTISWPGPYGVLVRDKQTLTSEGNKTGAPLMEFYHPDVNILEYSWKGWQELLKMAEQAIGLDLLDGTGVESGTAKDMRLEDLHDLLMNIAIGAGSFGLSIMRQLEALLVPFVDQRIEVSYRLPTSFKLKDPNQLLEAANNALREDRFIKRLEYYRHEYIGQEVKIKGYKTAMLYAPALLLSTEEIPGLLAAGALTREDLIKRDNVMIAIVEISERDEIEMLEMTTEQIFAEIDRYLIERQIIIPLTPLEEEETKTRSPLLDTIGGVTGIVQIVSAVGAKEITEESAKNVLMEVYGLNEETADRMIGSSMQIPTAPPATPTAPRADDEGEI